MGRPGFEGYKKNVFSKKKGSKSAAVQRTA